MADQDLMNSQDPMQQQMVGTPPPFMQGQISPMMTGAPPQAGGVLPPSNPVDAAQGPQPQGDPNNPFADPRMREALVQGTQTAMGGPGQVGGLYGREQASMGPTMGGQGPQSIQSLIQQRDALSGQQSFHPSFQHGQGAGGFFHNLGQALLALGAATRPGQAIDAVTHSKARQEYAGMSDQIKSLQEQQKVTQEGEGPLSNVPIKTAGMMIGEQKAQTGQDRVAAYTQHINDQARQYVSSLNLRQASLNERTQNDLAKQIQAKADEAGRDFRSLHRDATTEEVAAVVTGSRQSIADEAAVRDPSLKGWLFNKLGMDVPQLPGGDTPEMRPAAKGPSSPEASAAAGAPKRPPGVPAGAKWNPQTRRWSM